MRGRGKGKGVSCRLPVVDHAFVSETARAQGNSQNAVVASAVRDMRTLFGVAVPDRERLQADREALNIETNRDYVAFVLQERARLLNARQSPALAPTITAAAS